MRLRVLDAAAGLEQIWFVNQFYRMAGINVSREEIFESVRELVSIDDERFHADVDQMIQRESNERLLENRNERLRQIVSQRTQSRTETSAKNEGQRYFSHRWLVLGRTPVKTFRMAEEIVWRGS